MNEDIEKMVEEFKNKRVYLDYDEEVEYLRTALTSAYDMGFKKGHVNVRKLGTSDVCVCCPCGCDMPIDKEHYECFHGMPCPEHESIANKE